ncbi:lysophospholipase [Peribacillus deserti]|uniref:Lysophospholipase n=1 Tax=Peribacillus deserti TaxID=673318 RepID=A0ABS2QL28_9BACI|nr:alpha/beta hydrolase [Peribacillus deserti]MBM7692966.1 lysophospholipase [Peribacillus deserti]
MHKWEAANTARGVIVMVHGALEHHGRYRWLIEMWRAAGFHVVMGDLPGQGMTTRSRRGHIDSFEEYINTIKEWVRAAYEYEMPVFLLGHSMGGLAVIRLLQQERLNLAGIILSSPCLGLVHYPSKALSACSVVLNAVIPTLRMDPGLTVQMATRNDEVLEVDVNDSLYVTKVSVRWYRELIGAMKEAFEEIPDLQDIPILLMQGGDDRIVDKKAVKEWFNYILSSEKQYKEWPGLFHEIFNEPEREDVFEYARGFVENRLRLLGYIY